MGNLRCSETDKLEGGKVSWVRRDSDGDPKRTRGGRATQGRPGARGTPGSPVPAGVRRLPGGLLPGFWPWTAAACGCCGYSLAAQGWLFPALPAAAPPPGRCVPVSSPETSLGEAGPSLQSGGRGGPRVGRQGGLAWLGTAPGSGTWRGLSGRPGAACDSDQVGSRLSSQPRDSAWLCRRGEGRQGRKKRGK